MISIILPVFKSTSYLEELIHRLHRSLDAAEYPHEIICVNDCCPDPSLTVLKKILSQDKRLRILDLKENIGQHKAVLTGMVYAKGEWIAVMDADLQDPPEALPALIDMAQKKKAIIFAGRRGRYESMGRLFTSKIFKTLLSLIVRVPKDAGMFFVIPQSVKAKIITRPGNKPFVLVMLGMESIAKISYPVERARKLFPTSGYSSLQRLIVGIQAVTYALQCRLGLFCSKNPDYTCYVRSVING